jgi:PTH2 family peptidyl-tRNA hydrolase
MTTTEQKMVLVVRGELGLTPGKMAAQVAHAAVMLVTPERARRRREYQQWLLEGQKKVALQVETLAELQSLRRRAEGLGIPTVVVEDAGLTEVPPGTITVLGLGPSPRELLDRVTGSLPLA